MIEIYTKDYCPYCHRAKALQIFVHGLGIGGSDDLMQLDASGKFDAMLSNATAVYG